MGAKLSKRRFRRRNSDDIEEELEDVSRHGRPSVKYSVPLSRATKHDFQNFNVSDQLTGIIATLQEQEQVGNLSGIVACLEKNALSFDVHVEGNVLLRVDSSDQIVIEQASPHSEGKEDLLASSQVLKGSDDCSSCGHPVSIPPNQNSSTRKGTEKVNINCAGVEALERIKGIGPVLAVRVIEYRNLHGPFSKFEELTAVKGVSKRLLLKIQPYLTLDDLEEEKEESKNMKNKETSAGGWRESFKWKPPRAVGAKYNGRDVVRVASWNLQRLSSDKVNNEGVREVVCRTVLENGINILAIQEIGDMGALQQIRDELNNPGLKAVKKCKGNRQQWECSTSDVAGYMFRSKEFNGFLWDSSLGIKLKSAELLEKPTGKKQFARRPFMGYFEAKEFDFILVSVHLKATGLDNEDLSRLQEEIARVPDLAEALCEHVPGEKDTVIVGDFNLGPDEKEFDSLRATGHANLIPGSSFTNISVKNMSGSKCYDNIWVASGTRKRSFTTRAGVIRQGLRHQAIPDGWKKNGLASDHCPVWAEFYCDQDHDEGTGAGNLAGVSIASVK